MRNLCLASIMTLAIIGCSHTAHVSSKSYQRFVPIPANTSEGIPWNGYFALDTKTGQVCWTVPAPHPPTQFGTLPNCVDLAAK